MAAKKETRGLPQELTTASGKKIIVPPTLDTVAFLLPQNISVAATLTLFFFLVNLFIFARAPFWLCFASFVFWRLAYNVGIGLLLRSQSRGWAITRWCERAADYSPFMKGQLLRAASALLDRAKAETGGVAVLPIEEYPVEFRSWLLFRHLVNVILCNDVLCYVLLGYRCFERPEMSLSVLAQYAVALFSFAFNYWAKVDAHRCIGVYCWYWGDFFFRKTDKLTFDGIFELFPHPMYTVGYAAYYGYALLCQSYWMLFSGLFAHMSQLAFLNLVEEPHMDKLYGSGAGAGLSDGGNSDSNSGGGDGAGAGDPSQQEADEAKRQEVTPRKKEASVDGTMTPPTLSRRNSLSADADVQTRVLYGSGGYFPQKRDAIFIFSLDILRSSDMQLLIILCYGVVSTVFCPRPWLVVQVVLWRLFHWLGLGTLLYQQSTRRSYTRHFLTRGRTVRDAFRSWKGLYNMSVTMNVVVFAAATFHFVEYGVWDVLTNPKVAASLVVGLTLIALQVWSSSSSYSVLGDFGWYYGDFFIPRKEFHNSLSYTGVYRYLNNPDCVTGYAGLYGASLAARSWTLLIVTVGTHLLNLVFLHLVEIPHMRRMYVGDKDGVEEEGAGQEEQLRKEGPLSRRVNMGLASVLGRRDKAFDARIRSIKAKAFEKIYKLVEGKENQAAAVSAGGGRVELIAPTQVRVGQWLEVEFRVLGELVRTPHDKGDRDWIGLLPADVPSGPGLSNGCWLFVDTPDASLSRQLSPEEKKKTKAGDKKKGDKLPLTRRGVLRFPPTVLPHAAGVYEVRYHSRGYDVRAAVPIVLEFEETPDVDEGTSGGAERVGEGEGMRKRH